ncbi:hypothetical protein CASFOL_008649 [Castilleja foliolosa]|uniref:UDENN domain-containing protein n=1 Tax=Castilleja foliolosa TaxID=1961234 RepID=A0ABD3E3M8_9LAMI
MDTGSKEYGDTQENWWSAPSSPIEVLQKFSKNAVKRASESWNSNSPNSERVDTHRRTHSQVASSFPRSSSSVTFQKWKSQVQKALYWRSRSFCEDRPCFSFDPEILANQKREWYEVQSKGLDPDKFKEPASLFEHFVVVGLRPDVNLDVFEDAVLKRKMLESNERIDFEEPLSQSMEPQVLFKYPPGEKLALRLKDLASFCFPGGVKAGILKRTPSLSELNELLYGQGHLYREDTSFIFSIKVADSATLYGVCLHVQEFVQEPPIVSSSFSQSPSGRSRFLVSAPRCYCILTRVPFFELHFEILNSIIAQKHLNRVSQNHHITVNHVFNSLGDEGDADWTATSIPVDSALPTTAGSISEDEVQSLTWEICSPDSTISSDDKDSSKNMNAFDQFSDNSFSSAISMGSDEDADETFYNHARDDITENNNDLVKIISGYHSMPVPQRGSEIHFQPLEHLKPVEFQRPRISALGLCSKYLDLKLDDPNEVSQVKMKLAAAEEALALSHWSTATICRVLSLENVLALVTGVLLEKQVVILCPNLGVLSAVVLSIIPIIRPFEWQSLFLPILPVKMQDFLDAPVPFIVGLQHKPDDLKMKASYLVQVNVDKNQVKSRDLPQLPRSKELISELKSIHASLSCDDYTSQKHPVYKCDDLQAKAAKQFLVVMRRYMESLCSDLRSHTITSVQSNNDRVSILLKDSFIDSFPVPDQNFVKLFVETQLFTVLSDSRLSSFDNEHY